MHKKNIMVGPKRRPKQTKSQNGKGLATTQKQIRLATLPQPATSPNNNKEVVEEEEQCAREESEDLSVDKESCGKDVAVANMAGDEATTKLPTTVRHMQGKTTSPPCTADLVVFNINKVNPVSPYASGVEDAKPINRCALGVKKIFEWSDKKSGSRSLL